MGKMTCRRMGPFLPDRRLFSFMDARPALLYLSRILIMNRLITGVALLWTMTGATFAQTMVPGRNIGQSPVLWTRFHFPDPCKITVYPDPYRKVAIGKVEQIGLRPGYVYRIKIENLPEAPGQELYPTLEVRGSLNMPRVADPAKFPAIVRVHQHEIESALRGGMITKIIYLEDSGKAEPTQSNLENPIETQVPQTMDLYEEARRKGRPMLVFRMGGKSVSEQELKGIAIPGTMHCPKDPSLGPPRLPPIVPFEMFSCFDPFHGPKPSHEELIRDGGDHFPKAGTDNQGQLQGVNPEDTVAQYRDTSGKQRLSRSNTVIISAPRFAILSQGTLLNNVHAIQGFNEERSLQVNSQFRLTANSSTARSMDHLNSYKAGLRLRGTENTTGVGKIQRLEVVQAQVMDLVPLESIDAKGTMSAREARNLAVRKQLENVKRFSSALGMKENIGLTGTSVVGRIENGPDLVQARAETREAVLTEGGPAEVEIDKPLGLLKLADKSNAQVGEVVTFTLRYTNQGSKPISDLAVLDSLHTRLEYVENSAKSDRDAVFSMQKNEAGSLILRWEVTGQLMPKEYGIIRFQARVR